MKKKKIVANNTVIVIGNAPNNRQVSNKYLKNIVADKLVIAADGGAHYAQKYDIKMDYIIGDNDSVNNIENTQNTKVIISEKQDNNDFQKVLQIIKAPLIIAFGCWQKRADHAIANLTAATQSKNNQNIVIVTDEDLIWCTRNDAQICCQIGTRVSIIPLTVQKFKKSRGLKWPLDNMRLNIRNNISLSNETTKEEIFLQTARGHGYAVILPIANFDSIISQLTDKLVAKTKQQNQGDEGHRE